MAKIISIGDDDRLFEQLEERSREQAIREMGDSLPALIDALDDAAAGYPNMLSVAILACGEMRRLFVFTVCESCDLISPGGVEELKAMARGIANLPTALRKIFEDELAAQPRDGPDDETGFEVLTEDELSGVDPPQPA